MLKRVKFEELKFGDNLCYISQSGDINFHTYLSRDPHWVERYCFLDDGLGSAENFSKEVIEEEMYQYDTVKEVQEKANQMRGEYYISWLKEHNML